MQLLKSYITYILLLCLVSGFIIKTDKEVADFSLKNVNNQMISTQDYKNAKGFILIFTCNHCPFAKLYTKRMNDLNKKYSKLDVPLLAINSMDTLVYEDEVFEKMQEKAKKEKFNFPYLQDAAQSVGKAFAAEHTPMAYVIWKENNTWRVKYKGSIDDNGEKPKAATPYIANAVNELLLNKKVSMPETQSFGCRIMYRKTK